MNQFHNQTLETMVKGWTRIDMLLALYDRTIATVRSAMVAFKADDSGMLATKLLDTNRLILGLHSGLDTENSEVAKNVARLLHFISMRIQEHNFEEALHFLDKLHNSFLQIHEEATELERNGKIPPLVDTSAFNAMA